MVKKVISGGQTGVDRAALDAALAAGIPVGGFCPRGRLAEDGTIPPQYPMTELDSPDYAHRTEKNVARSDGTLILNRGPLSEGTKATLDFVTMHRKPHLVVQLDRSKVTPEQVAAWLKGQEIRVLNVAGPRESKWPEGVYSQAYAYLLRVFSKMKELA